MISQLIDRHIQETCRLKFKNEGIRSFLLNHERLPLLKENLLKEIFELDKVPGVKLSGAKIKSLVESFFEMFAKAALTAKAAEIRAKEKHGLKLVSEDSDVLHP